MMTDNEIIKALACCRKEIVTSCCDCPYWGVRDDGCNFKLSNDALDLINRQKAKIEELQSVNADMQESLRLAAEANKDMQAEIERLKKENDVLREDNHILATEYAANVKAEAIKEFAERMKAEEKHKPLCICGVDIFNKRINNLVKEMTEEQNNV